MSAVGQPDAELLVDVGHAAAVRDGAVVAGGDAGSFRRVSATEAGCQRTASAVVSGAVPGLGSSPIRLAVGARSGDRVPALRAVGAGTTGEQVAVEHCVAPAELLDVDRFTCCAREFQVRHPPPGQVVRCAVVLGHGQVGWQVQVVVHWSSSRAARLLRWAASRRCAINTGAAGGERVDPLGELVDGRPVPGERGRAVVRVVPTVREAI
ncbi:hypothetical protein [Saccharopolyspora spinosa]|uniref:hypothetical protein n=1 Tax=Saccharopolyspora spinosa TaxID=60894 RepID=UPI00192BD1CB|nr:hypothetical protein [Saccharopolyspora spinosa]